MKHYRKWQLLSPLGLATIGLGLSVLGDTIERKAAGKAWFVRGTIALSLVNAGVCLVGDAVKSRVLHELGVPDDGILFEPPRRQGRQDEEDLRDLG